MRKMRYASHTKVTSVVMAVLMTLFFMLSLAPASLAVQPGGGDPDCPTGTSSVKLDNVDSIDWALDTWHAVDDGTSGIEVKFTVGSSGDYHEFDWRSTKDDVYVEQVYIKAGNDNPAGNTFTYDPPSQGAEGLTPQDHAISHITFCWLVMETPDCPEIDFEITKTADSDTVAVGEMVYYTIRLENLGDAVEGVQVDDERLGFHVVVSLDEDEVREFVYDDYNELGEMMGEECITNVVYATYSSPGVPGLCITECEPICPPIDVVRWDTEEVCPPDPCPDIDFDVTKTVNASSVEPGDTVYFTIRLENLGDEVDGVNVVDPLLGISETDIHLAVDEVVYFEYPDYPMDYYMEGEGCVTNVVYATYGYVYGEVQAIPSISEVIIGDCPPIGMITRWDSEVVCATEPPPCPEMNFEITKTVNDSSVIVGETVYFEIRLENTGETLIDMVYVEDEMFDWGRYVYDLDVGDVVYFRDHSQTSAVDEVVYYHDLDYTFTDDICVTNVVYATYGYMVDQLPVTYSVALIDRCLYPPITRWDDATACARYEIQKEPDIDIEKLVDGEDSVTIRRGQEVTYSITVTNTGDYDLPCVRVVDETLDWFYIFEEDLVVGDSVTFYIYDNPTSSVTNTAYAEDCEFKVYDEDDARVSIRTTSNKEYEVEIEKLVDGKKVVTVDEGTEVTYTITVTNTGDYDLFDLVVEDIDLGLYFEIDELEEDEEWTTEFDYTPLDTLTNTASVTDEDRNLYDEDDAKVNVIEEVPEPEEPEDVPEPFEPAALPYTGASGNVGGIGVLMLAAAATIKRKF